MDFTAGLSWSVTEAVEQSVYITVKKNDTAAFMLCLDLSLSNKGQINWLAFTWIELVACVLDHYVCEKIWILWWHVLLV